MAGNFSFYLVTDPHFFELSLGGEGEAYEARSRTDQKCVAETGAIIDAGFLKIAEDRETNVILIPGDLVYRGEQASNEGFIKKLQWLESKGKTVYLITARHDYGETPHPVGFVGKELVPVEGTPREKLRELYYHYGFEQAISEHESMSYVVQLTDKIRLLALNCDGDCKGFKGLWPDQLEWALEQIKDAHDNGCYIFAMTHYPLLPFSPFSHLVGDSHLTDWEMLANTFADAGLDLIFTGHMHAQAVTEYESQNGNMITDVQTGSFVGYPCSYRKVTFLDGDKIDIKSYTIEDFDWDKGGRTAEEYFRWRFDRMITDIIDAMAYDFAFFTRLFGGPEKNKKLKVPVTAVGKLLQKLTLKGLGRLFCFRVDKSIENILVKDLAVEFVRNAFGGDEPYVDGTPVNDAVRKLLKRLHPVTHIIEKKIGAKTPILADIDKFVLDTIGDEKQRDYNTVLNIKWQRKDWNK